MRVRMLRGTVGPDGVGCEAGTIADVPDAIARQWVASERAVAADEAPAVTAHDPAPRANDPQPKRRR